MAGEDDDGGGVFGEGSFNDLGLTDRLAEHLHGPMGFKTPTLVQKSAIPLLVSGRDLLVNSQTGTGKTVVYLAPIVHSLQAIEPKISRADGTFAMILVPTRELSIQVCAVAEQLIYRFHWLVPGHVMGGENRAKEKARIRKGITILIATPGRLLDHLRNTASFKHDKLKWIVFDEADKLLDMGFEKDIKSILEILNSEQRGGRRQHVLLSATLNEGVGRLAKLSLHDPATVGLSSDSPGDNDDPENMSSEYKISDKLQQFVVKVSSKIRLVALLSVLKSKLSSSKQKIVVFFSTCDAVDFHHAVLSSFSWSGGGGGGGGDESSTFLDCDVLKLHGNIPQQERTDTFRRFSEAQVALLLSTDVSARGLDFQGLSCIVQYDPPGEAVDYVHRVGRTARIGKKGEALLFLQPCESDYLHELKKRGVVLKEFNVRKALDSVFLGSRKRLRDDSEVLEMHPVAGLMQHALDSFVLSEGELKQLAVDAFRSSVRAYAVHRGSLKKIFQVRKLHLGHVAKSFGLRDAPSILGLSGAQKVSKKEKAENKKMNKRRKLHAHRMH